MESQGISDKNRERFAQIGTVLVIDDEDNWCFVTKLLLKDVGIGKQTLTAKNGLEALNKLQAISNNGEKLPELIFLDIKMPVMDGFEFLETLNKTPSLDLSQTKIFITTSSFLSKDKERAQRYPIAGFVTKPLTEEISQNILN